MKLEPDIKIVIATLGDMRLMLDFLWTTIVARRDPEQALARLQFVTGLPTRQRK
jgi:hypothetical protein